MILKFKKYYQEIDDEEVVFTCKKFRLTVEQTDIDASDDGGVYWTYLNCINEEVYVRKNINPGNYTICVKNDTVPIAYIIIGGNMSTDIDSVVTDLTESC